MEGKRQVVLFDSSDGEVSLDVAVDVTQEDVWLTKDQMGLLFGRDRTVISRHVSTFIGKERFYVTQLVQNLHKLRRKAAVRSYVRSSTITSTLSSRSATG